MQHKNHTRGAQSQHRRAAISLKFVVQHHHKTWKDANNCNVPISVCCIFICYIRAMRSGKKNQGTWASVQRASAKAP